MQTAQVGIKLGGLNLELNFEAFEMMRLHKLTGQNPLELLQGISSKRSNESAALGLMDMPMLVDMIAAGLCGKKEYESIGDNEIRRRVCKLIDAEVQSSKKAMPVLVVELATKIIPAVSQAVVPPGTSLEDLMSGGDEQNPLEDAPAEKASSAGAS